MFLCPPHLCVCLLPCLYRTLLTDPSANRHSDLFRTWFFCIVLLRTWDDRFLFKAVIFFSLDLDWEVRSLGRVMVLFFTFRETFIWFSIRAAPVYTSVDTEAGRLSSMLLVELVSSWCSDKGHPSKGEATPPGGFDLQNHACFHIPLVMHGFLGEKACRSFVLRGRSLGCCLAWVPQMFWILLLTRDRTHDYFLPFRRLPFHFADCFLCCTETLIQRGPTYLVFVLVPIIYILICRGFFFTNIEKFENSYGSLKYPCN